MNTIIRTQIARKLRLFRSLRRLYWAARQDHLSPMAAIQFAEQRASIRNFKSGR